MIALLVTLAAPNIKSRSFVRLQVAGLGRYNAAPAVFLERERGGAVLPLPIPRESELAFEQALSPQLPSRVDVLLHVRPFAQREGGVFDALPWEWNASPLAKRDGYSRLGGRDFPQGSNPPPSSFHLLLEAVRRDACADVARVLLVDEPNPNRDGIVVGGCLVLERRLPAAGSAAGLRPRDAALRARTDDEGDVTQDGAAPCGCAADEALGLAVALRQPVEVEASVWEAAARPPKYSTQRGRLRICVEDADDGRARLARRLARGPPSVRAPWELSLDEFDNLPLEDRALAALAGGLRLPRVASTEETMSSELGILLEPLLDADVRRELRARRALADKGKFNVWEAAAEADLYAVEASLAARERLAAQMAKAVKLEEYSDAKGLQEDLAAETEYLDELLDSLPVKGFTRDVFQLLDAAKRDADDEGDGDEAFWLERFLEDGDEEGWRRVQRAARRRRAEAEFAMAFIDGFRGSMRALDLLRLLERERERWRDKEERRGDGGDDESDELMAPRVARQLVFALDDRPAQASVAALCALVDASRRGEGAAAAALRELSTLTWRLEDVARRARAEEEALETLEGERRELAEAVGKVVDGVSVT